jgi:glycosyltransferase involved in cell wall biosynthesis
MNRVTAVLCVYNELSNLNLIKRNIALNYFDEIIIVDGGSNDGTYESLSCISDIFVYKLFNAGLLIQRLYGISRAKNEMVFLFNADDDLSTLNIPELIEELEIRKCHGLQVRIQAEGNTTFWQRSWSSYFNQIYPRNRALKVLGRPCMTYTRLFEGIVVEDNIFNEDTYLKYYQESAFGPMLYFASSQFVERVVPNSFKLNIIQFRRYGISDSMVARNSVSIFFSLLYHSFIRIMIVRSSVHFLRDFSGLSFLFVFSMGFTRGFSLLFGTLKSRSK